MSRRTRVQYSLNSGDIKTLSDNDIKMILRAADELISIGGRNMLVKILKGSKDKKVLEYKLDECPAYGFYKSLTMEEISFRVDWMIKKDYIRLDYNGRLPMLMFSEKGWAVEEETFAEEIYQKFYRDLKKKKPEIISEMKDVNRQVVLDVLEKIRASKNADFIPILELWKAVEVRKIRERITGVQRSLGDTSIEPIIEFRKAGKDNWREVMDVIHKTVQKVYPDYYSEEVVQFFCLYHDRHRIQKLIELGGVWILQSDGRIIGTGSIEEQHVTGVYVLPELQSNGYGTRIMHELEKIIAGTYEKVELEASLPAYNLYEKLGYKTVRQGRISLINDVVLDYAVMEKVL